MAQAIMLPNSKPKSTRDEVINLLSERWPLSVKQIHSEINRMNGGVSYQAVHKTVQQMEGEGVIEKKGKEYCLNEGWIKNLKRHSTELEQAYTEKKGYSMQELLKKDSVNLSFDTVIDLGRFLIFKYFNYPNPNKEPMAIIWWHMYSVIGLSDEMLKATEETLHKNGCYILIGYDCPMDKFFIENAVKLGAKVKMGVDLAKHQNIMVVGDHVMHIHFCPEHRKVWHESYKVQKLDEFNLNELMQIMIKRNYESHVYIHRDPKVAKELREEVLGYFKEAKK